MQHYFNGNFFTPSIDENRNKKSPFKRSNHYYFIWSINLKDNKMKILKYPLKL